MIRRTCVLAICALLLDVAVVHAHFIWLDLKTNEERQGSTEVRLYFSETPAPGEPHLIGKTLAAKIWARSASGQTAELKLAKAGNEASPALMGSSSARDLASIEGTLDYGVYDRGGPGVLLQYYAKCLPGNWSAQPGPLARAQRLAFDIVPRLDGKTLELSVLYQGRPAAGSEVVVIDAAGSEQTLKSDAAGKVTASAPVGRVAVRAAHIEAERGGERDGKKYVQTWHYCTLVLEAPAAAQTAEQAGSPAGMTAADALAKARAARSVWQSFPGFSADITVTGESGQVSGKMSINGEGTVSLEMPESPLAEWVEEQLQTLVQHRMPDGEVIEGAITYAEQGGEHPLGRKIDLGDPTTQSVYRIKDDVIMEVNRNAGKMRFTISVLEIRRNLENKYLPRSFTMNFFDAATGELKTSLAYFNDWQRVGAFDLPKTILETGAHRGGAHTRQITFSSCRLLSESTAQAKAATAGGK